MYSYILLVCALILFFSAFCANSLASLNFNVTLATVVSYRLSWVLLLILSSMAALPPSFFFFSKLGLLSSVILFGAWHVTGLFLSYVLFSWGVYYGALRYFLFSVKTTSPVILSHQRLSANSASTVVLVIFFLTLTLFFFDDVFFFVYWVLV